MKHLLPRIALSVLLATTALTGPAHAGPVIPAVASFLFNAGLVSSVGAGITAATIGVELTLSVGLSYLAKALTPAPSTDMSQIAGGTSGKLQASGTVPRSFIVGRAATAGSLVYANTYSSAQALAAAAARGLPTDATGNTPNVYLVQVIALSDLPVTGLAGMLVDGSDVTYDAGATAAFEGIGIPQYGKAGSDFMWVRFYDGRQAAADPQLVQLFGADPDRPYGADRVGHGIAYAVVTCRLNETIYSGFPQFKFVIDGIPLYDRRYDSTAGGAGSQRWADPATWAFSGNNAVIVENILRGIAYDGTWLYGAQTVSAPQLPASSFVAAASECDVAIALADGGSEPQFRAGGEIRVDVQPADTLEEVLKACNGRLAEIGGAYKLRIGAAGAAVFSFADADILSTDQQTFDPFPGLQQTVNAVTAKYISPPDGWNEKDAPPLYDADLEAADGGRRQATDVQYAFVASGTQVQRLMKSERDTQRAFRRHTLPMPSDAFLLEPLDVIAWTSARNGYDGKTFDIVAMDDLPNVNVGISIQEIDPNAYDWTPALDERPVSGGSIAIVRPPAQPIVDWSVQPWTLHSDGAQDRAAIKLNWDPDTDDVDGVRYEVRLAASQEVVLRGSYSDRVKAGAIVLSQNLLPATAYQARGQYVPISARDTDWSDWLDVTTPDVRIVSAALDAAIQAKLDAALEAVAALNPNGGDLSGTIFEPVQTSLDELGQALADLRSDFHLALESARRGGIDIDPYRVKTTITALESYKDEVALAQFTLAANLDSETEARAAAALTLQSNIDANTAAITSEASTRATQDSALASSLSSLTSTVGANTAAITSESVTRANADSVLAARATALEVSMNGVSAAVTITIASPAVVTWSNHGLAAGRRVKFTTTGALPTGLAAGTYYYVLATGLTTNAFQVGTTPTGAAIATSGSQSGTHTATVEAVGAAISQEAIVRATQDDSIATTLTSVSSTVGANTAAITSEATTRATADTTLSNSLTTLTSTVNANTAAISSEATTRATADDALSLRADAIESALNGKSAAVTITIASPAVVTWSNHGLAAGRRVKFTTTGALPTGLAAGTYYYILSAGLASNTFRLSAAAEGAAINTSGSQSGTHTATIEPIAAAISNEAVTRAAQDGSIASSLTSLTANYNDLTASGTFRVTASASIPTGALAAADWQMRAGVGDDYANAGIQLVAYVDAAGNALSRTRIYADLMQFGTTDSDGTFTTILGMQTVSGSSRLSIVPEAMPDAIIDTRSLILGAVVQSYRISGTDQPTADGNTWYNGGSGAALMSTTVPMDADEVLDVEFNGFLDQLGHVGNYVVNLELKVKINGSVVGSVDHIGGASTTALGGNSNVRFPIRIREQVSGLAAGDVSIQPWLYAPNGSGGSSLAVYDPKLLVTRLKKATMTAVAPLSSASVSYIGAQTGSRSGSTVTLSGAGIGTADANRVLALALSWRATQGKFAAIPTMTVGGVNAPFAVRRAEDNHVVVLYAVAYPTGTTATIVVSGMPDDADDIALQKWRVLANSATPYRTASATNFDGTGNATAWSLRINPNVGSAGVVAMAGRGSGSSLVTGYACAWSGSEAVTEDADSAASLTDTRYAGYHLVTTGNHTSDSCNFSVSGSNPGTIGCVAAFFR